MFIMLLVVYVVYLLKEMISGKLMWKTTEWSPATTAASPLFLGNNEIAVFGSYGAGGARIVIKF